MKRSKIRLSIISDPHIGERDEIRGRIDSRGSFRSVLGRVVEERPDVIILAGDLAAVSGEIESYRWIRSRLEEVAIPYIVMAGNHDTLSNLRVVFGLEEGPLRDELAFQRVIGGHSLFFLDSSTGSVSDAQLRWLTMEAARLDGEALLFVHHPPLMCDCLFMDQNYPMVNREKVLSVLLDIPTINTIFCGHYHTEKTVVERGKLFFLCPSTMISFEQDDPDFKVDFSTRENFIGWRTVDWDGESLKTRTRYLSGMGSLSHWRE